MTTRPFRISVLHALPLLMLLALSTAAQAGPIAIAGTLTNTGVFTQNATAISNPAGAAETRGVIAIDFDALAAATSTALGSVDTSSFTLDFLVTVPKTVGIAAYAADMAITSADFNPFDGQNAVSIFTQAFQPTGSAGTSVTVDISQIVATLLASSGPHILGFTIVESENSGNIVALEYLLVATIEGLSLQVGQTANNGVLQNPVATAVPEPASMFLAGASLAAFAIRRYRQG